VLIVETAFFKYSSYQTKHRYNLEDFFLVAFVTAPNLRFSSGPWPYVISFLHLWPLDGKSYVNMWGGGWRGQDEGRMTQKKINELMLRGIVVSISKYVPLVYFL